MTREDIKHDLQALIEYFNDERGASPICLQECLNILEQEFCENAISKQAVLEMAYDMSEIDGEHFTEPHMVVDVEDIQKLSSVKPQEETGHWKEPRNPYDIDGTYYCYCDNCGGDAHEMTDFCPNCGAKMVDSDIDGIASDKLTTEDGEPDGVGQFFCP